jgi:hypothetical protein
MGIISLRCSSKLSAFLLRYCGKNESKQAPIFSNHPLEKMIVFISKMWLLPVQQRLLPMILQPLLINLLVI